jgi:flagellar hook-length control protein FliK
MRVPFVTATPNISSVVPATAASRAALNVLPSDIGAMFAELLNGVTQSGAVDAQDRGSESVHATDHDDVDRTLALQRQTLLSQSQPADIFHSAATTAEGCEPPTPEPQTSPAKATGTTAPAALAGNLLLPPGPSATPTSARGEEEFIDAPSTGATGQTTSGRETPKPTAAARAATQLLSVLAKLGQPARTKLQFPPSVDDLPGSPESDAQQALNVLAKAANAARQQPAVTATARTLSQHIEAANDRSDSGQKQSSEHHGQPANSGTDLKTSDVPTDLNQPAARASAPSQTAPQQAAQDAQPEAQTLAAAPSAQVVEQGPRQIPVALHVGPQTESGAAPPSFGTLAMNIAAKSKNGEKHFDIRLDPPELGRVEVKLSIDDAGKAQANLAVEKPHTLDLLQRDRSTLERALRDAGLDLAGGSLNFSLKGQEREPNAPAPGSRNMSLSAIAQDDSNIVISSHHLIAADSRLDIRV